MAKIEKVRGLDECQHSYANGGKKHVSVNCRFCTKCGHRELFSDSEEIPADMLDKIFKEA